MSVNYMGHACMVVLIALGSVIESATVQAGSKQYGEVCNDDYDCSSTLTCAQAFPSGCYRACICSKDQTWDTTDKLCKVNQITKSRPCDNENICTSNLQCMSGVCGCDGDRTWRMLGDAAACLLNTQRLPGESCDQSHDCYGGKCHTNVCYCNRDGEHSFNHVCRKPQLDEFCVFDADCDEVPHSICLKEKCTCLNSYAGYSFRHGSVCKLNGQTRVGNPCGNHDDCSGSNVCMQCPEHRASGRLTCVISEVSGASSVQISSMLVSMAIASMLLLCLVR